MKQLDSFLNWVNHTITPLSNWFNQQTANIDFFGFCLIYSILFLFIGYRLHRRQGWVAENK